MIAPTLQKKPSRLTALARTLIGAAKPSPSGPDPKMPLSAWYYEHFVDAYLRRATPMTRRLYENALAWFIKLEGDLPLASFVGPSGVMHLSNFRDTLLASPLAQATALKHLRHLMRIVRKAGPADVAQHCDAMEILPSVSMVKRPRLKLSEPRVVTPEEWIGCYVAADVARMPKVPGLCPADWWRATLVLSVALGPRSGTVMRIRVKDVELLGPEPRIRFRDEDKTAKERYKPLKPEVASCLEKLLKHGHEYLLPWPHGHKTDGPLLPCFKPACQAIRQSRSKQLHLIQEAAGVDELFTFHDLRRTAGTQQALEQGMRAAAAMLDHTSTGTTKGYYVPEDLVAGEIGGLTASALLRRAQARMSGQRYLFDLAPAAEEGQP